MRRKKARCATDLSLSPPSSAPPASAAFPGGGSTEDGGGGGGGGAGGGSDLISDLPDSVRLRIISFVPLKYAIRTGALSSRWRGLWRHRWPHPSSLDLLPPPPSSASDDFVAGVDRRLAARGRGRRIDGFFLTLPAGRRFDADVKRWLEYAASCGVEDLRIVVAPPPAATSSGRPGRRVRRFDRSTVSSALFHSVCECSNLARLTLSGLHFSSPGATVKRLAALEVLSLHSAHITDAALRRIVAACPALRSLDIRLCYKLRRITINANSRLASITMVDCSRALEVSISARGLRRFKFSGNFLPSYSFDSPNRLEEVYMSSSSPDSILPQSNWVKTISELSNIRVLTLCNISLQYIAVAGANTTGEFMNMRNLRELQLLMGMMTNDNLMDIYSFFRLCRCARLEKLFVELPTAMHDSFLETYLVTPKVDPPEVDLEYLRIIKMNSFKGHKNEMQLVRFLLGKAGFLESLMIITPKELVTEEYAKHAVEGCPDFIDFLQQQMLLLTKASVNAQIIFSGHDDKKFNPTHWEVYTKF